MNDRVQSIPVSVDYRMDGKFSLLNLLGIKTRTINLNPNNDERAEDCAIRAILAVLIYGDDSKNKPVYTWDYVYDELCTIGRNQHRMTNNYWVVQEFMKKLGYTLVVPIKEVQLGTFLATHKNNNFIVSVDRHAFAYIKGTIYDTEPLFDEIGYNLGMPLKAIYVPKEIRVDLVFGE